MGERLKPWRAKPSPVRHPPGLDSAATTNGQGLAPGGGEDQHLSWLCRGVAQEVAELIQRVPQTRLYLVQRSGPTSFILREEGSEKKHRVMLGATPSCTCWWVNPPFPPITSPSRPPFRQGRPRAAKPG